MTGERGGCGTDLPYLNCLANGLCSKVDRTDLSLYVVLNMTFVRKRKLREPKGDQDYWLKQTPEKRVEAVETIRLTHHPKHVQQAFPRVARKSNLEELRERNK
jgi:hypothetical protein